MPRVKSLRSGRVFETLEVEGETLVSSVTPAPGDGCKAGDTFVLDHNDVVPVEEN